MGIFVNSLGDIVSTQPGYIGVKLVAYDDDTHGDAAEQIARRLRDITGTTDTVWYVAQYTHRVSPVFHSKVDARKWLRDNTPPSLLNDYQVLERQGALLDVAYTTSPA